MKLYIFKNIWKGFSYINELDCTFARLISGDGKSNKSLLSQMKTWYLRFHKTDFKIWNFIVPRLCIKYSLFKWCRNIRSRYYSQTVDSREYFDGCPELFSKTIRLNIVWSFFCYRVYKDGNRNILCYLITF